MAYREGTRALRLAGLVLLAALSVGGLPSGGGGAAEAATYAFANASPLQVYDRPAASGGRNEEFEFGKAYDVDEQTPEYVKLRVRNEAAAYVRAADVTLATSPQWLETTTGYNKTDREFVRFWNDPAKLKDFLSHPDTPGARWDYEEYFNDAPQFQLRLPVTGQDSVRLLGGSREVRIVSVLLPIPREMVRAFESQRAGFDKKIDLHIVADVSGSTRDFLEDAVDALAGALTRETFRDRVNAVYVTTFGASRWDKSAYRGRIAPDDLGGFLWRRRGINQTTDGEREPLVDGLLSMNRGLRPDSGDQPVLVVLSGADVDLVSSATVRGKPVAIENLDWKLPADAAAVFAQITPEPSDDLRTASQRVRGFSRVYYVEFSETLGDELFTNLARATESRTPVAARAFGPVASAAHGKKMMAFVPRDLTAAASLPGRPGAALPDWYAVRLWLAVDDLIWKVTGQ